LMPSPMSEPHDWGGVRCEREIHELEASYRLPLRRGPGRRSVGGLAIRRLLRRLGILVGRRGTRWGWRITSLGKPPGG
jgi:hypothetical protein